MFGKRTVIIIDGVSVDSSVGMSVSDDMTVMLAVGVIESEANVIMARISGRRFRCGNKHSLECKGQRGRHHHDDSDPWKKRLPSEVQRAGSSMISASTYTVGVR
jgi:hypothetical protein